MGPCNQRDDWLSAADEYIERVRNDWSHVGVAVAAVRGEELIYARGFGLRQIDRGPTIDPNTLFQVGSTTKAITTAALAILHDEGKVGWDDPIVDHLSEFRLNDPWLTRHVTVRDVITHRSGVVGAPFFALDVLDSDETIGLLRAAECEGRFRDCYRYSNLMYEVAGKVIEAVSGKPWQMFIKERLLAPLEMNRSGTTPFEFWDARHVAPTFFGSPQCACTSIADSRDANVAMPHGLDENGRVVVLPWQSYDGAAGAGALVSSVTDMANWIAMNLNMGCFRGRRLLGQSALQALHGTQNLHGEVQQFPFEGRETYAMGWFRSEYDGTGHLSHGGGMLGFPAYVALLPERRVGVVVLSNGPQAVRTPYTMRKSIAFWILDRLLGRTLKDWNAEFMKRSRVVELERRRAEEELIHSRGRKLSLEFPPEAYAGLYRGRHTQDIRIRIHAEDGVLKLCFQRPGAFSAVLELWHDNMFRIRATRTAEDVLGPQFVRFGVAPNGTVDSLLAFDFAFDRVLE